MDILRSITEQRRTDVEAAKRAVSPATLEARARGRTHHSLRAALAGTDRTRIIAEMKKGSPSAGLLCADYRPADIARTYRDAGAVALSVLTEPHRFLGGTEDLRAAREAVDLPILRKDFMIDPYQVVEAAAWGADAILLIVAALPPTLLRELYAAAREHRLEVLVESHAAAELDLALSLADAIIGVNSRNLKTLRTDLAVARELATRIPATRLSIAESGIQTRADIEALERAGYRGFLIGETLMRAPDPAAALRALRG